MKGNKMSETKTPLTLNRGKLELKKPLERSQIRSNYGASSKVVQVEVRKKRTAVPASQSTSALSQEDQAQKLKLLMEAKKVEEQRAKERAEDEARRAALKAEEEAKKAEMEEKLQQEQQEKALQQPVVDVPQESVKNKEKKHYNKDDDDDEDDENDHKNRKKMPSNDKNMMMPKRSKGAGEERRQSGRINVAAYMSGDDDDDDGWGQRRGRSLASIRRAREKEKLKHQEALKTAEKISRDVVIPETITVQELANRMAERAATVVKTLMNLGVMATITQTIDADTAELVAEELGHKVTRVAESDVENILKSEEDKPEDLLPRPPVVTVMGHVDHGKTSLLDALRSTNVVSGEAGGITQHIGAYQVTLANGQKVTFIDTPGHAAFTAMRARGAKITDVVILVVAANDGVMPQTIEAIAHAKAANVPIVVAINKIDVVGANPEKVKMDLLNHEVVVESLGGETLCVEVSAKQKLNLDKLVEAVLLQAEVLDLKANPDHSAQGVVVESKMEKGRGPVATVLISRGTLKVGDVFVVGQEWGRVRSLLDDKGQRLQSALPAQPVEVVGLQGVPAAGDDLFVVESESKAREVSGYRQRKAREALSIKRVGGSTMEQMFAQIKAGETKTFPVIVKGDVQGSVEALQGTLAKIANDEVRINVIHAGVGSINESDVTLARASNATIIGFNVRANPQARENAKRDGVDIRYYSIIYDVADDMKKAVEGLLTPEEKEKILGYAEVRQVIHVSKVGNVAGCMVTEGLVKRGAKVRVLRDNVVIHEGELSQLKRFKDDVKEVKSGFDCGMSFENYDDIKEGDMIECFEVEKVAVSLDIKV
ncbi:MAG: translation initiation factor IF-2 [Alphaproteobacteria bacterium]|nr:translation initiation factor IF-2 [Alphaproteobacteria bacterium]